MWLFLDLEEKHPKGQVGIAVRLGKGDLVEKVNVTW